MDISTIFNDFCKYFDGNFKWNLSPAQRTEAILHFFSQLYKKQYTYPKEGNPLKEEREYMYIDYLWRYTSGSYQKIELVVEHENMFSLGDFLKSEVLHLLDIKADNKIAITYPQSGEEELIIKVSEKIKSYPTKLSEYSERYLLILGFSTRKRGKPAVRFKGYLFDNKGELKDTKDQTILQHYKKPSRN